MPYIDQLTDAALNNQCPGCGPNMLQSCTAISFRNLPSKYCKCCGWFVTFGPDGPETGSYPSDPFTGEGFLCLIQYPEHRAAWPKPEYDANQPDEFTEEELAQALVESDPNHPYIANDERCGSCGNWAPHKIAEEKWDFRGHPYSSALCCDCFERIFGSASHRYPKIFDKPSTGEI